MDVQASADVSFDCKVLQVLVVWVCPSSLTLVGLLAVLFYYVFALAVVSSGIIDKFIKLLDVILVEHNPQEYVYS